MTQFLSQSYATGYVRFKTPLRPVSRSSAAQVNKLLREGQVTTTAGFLPLASGVTEVSICCHSDTPVRLQFVSVTKS